MLVSIFLYITNKLLMWVRFLYAYAKKFHPKNEIKYHEDANAYTCICVVRTFMEVQLFENKVPLPYFNTFMKASYISTYHLVTDVDQKILFVIHLFFTFFLCHAVHRHVQHIWFPFFNKIIIGIQQHVWCGRWSFITLYTFLWFLIVASYLPLCMY